MLPAHLLGAADFAGNGEAFWSRDGAHAAAVWLAEHGRAITGGEVYRRHGGAWGTYLRKWTTEPAWRDGEPWAAYVQRGVDQALAALADDPPGWDEFPELRSEPIYFFAVSAEDEYAPPLEL